MINTAKEKIKERTEQYFLRLKCVDTIILITIIFSLSLVIADAVPNFNASLLFSTIIVPAMFCIALTLRYMSDKVLAYFGKAKAREEDAKKCKKEHVVFEGNFDQLTSNLYKLGFRLSERIGEYYAFKIKHFMLPNGHLLVKEVDGFCKIYSDHFAWIAKLETYLNLKFLDKNNSINSNEV